MVTVIECIRSDRYNRIAQIIEKITFVSYGDSILLSKTISNAVIVSQPHNKCGKIAVSLIKMMLKHNDITSMTASIKCRIYDYASSPPANIQFSNYGLEPTNAGDTQSMRNDPEIAPIAMIENLLETCTQIEIKIIDLFISGLTYEAIAGICSMSPNAIKYHMKKMLKKINCSSRKEFEKLLNKYNYKSQ